MKSLETTVRPGTKIFLLSVLLITGCSSKKEQVVAPPVKVNVVKAVVNDVPLYEDFVAQVYGESDVDIRSRVEGWVTSVNFKEGSAVKKGSLLYVIDDSQYQTRVDREANELARAKTELVRTQNELSRVKPLTELNALSQKDLDNATAAHDAAEAQVKASEASLRNARIEYGYTRVSAPFDGVVGISNVRVGDYVSRAGGTSVLTTISSIRGVRIRFQISEREYLRIAQMTKEELSSARKNVQLILADGSLYPEKGEVNFADRQIDSRTLKVNIVETGPKVGDAWIITKGLKEGDKVAVIGTASLTPNTKIELVEMKWPVDAQ